MNYKVDADALGPLWSVAESDPEPAVRIAALDAALRFPLTEDAWRRCAGLTQKIIVSEPDGSPTRRTALHLAARIPLLSVRHHLRIMAADPAAPDRDAVAAALDHIGDRSRIRPLLESAWGDRGESFQKLAAMPVEDEGIAPEDIPPLREGAVPNAPLWRALLLGRLGDFHALDAILENADSEPELFWGDPWTAYNTISLMRPVPQRMREHLLDALGRLANSEHGRMVQLIAWAATGIADPEGSPILQVKSTDIAAVPSVRTPSREELRQAIAASKWLPQRLFERKVTPGDIEILAYLPPDHFATLLKQTVIEGNRRARAYHRDTPVNVVLGNEILQVVRSRAASADLPAAEIALEHVKAERSALDDGQMAWIIARDRPDHLIQKMTGVLNPKRPSEERLRILSLLGTAADYQAGRGGSPWRGAGPGGREEPAGRGALIDDMPRAAASAPPSPPSGEVEERRVHAQIWHEGKRRHTFLTGADNVIRCWIGMPEPEQAAVASGPIPKIEIPTEGALMTAELCWGSQSDRKQLVLPAERSARTGDCDLRIHVPDGERYVSAEIVFRFRGRAFEVVQVEAFALAPSEQEQPEHKVRVRV